MGNDQIAAEPADHSEAFAKVPTFRELYKQTYKARTSWVKATKLPAALPHLNEGMKADHIELRAAGRCVLDGHEYEFHDIRVYVDDTREPPDGE